MRESYSELREHLNAKTVRGPNPGFWRICGTVGSNIFVCVCMYIIYIYICVLYIYIYMQHAKGLVCVRDVFRNPLVTKQPYGIELLYRVSYLDSSESDESYVKTTMKQI